MAGRKALYQGVEVGKKPKKGAKKEPEVVQNEAKSRLADRPAAGRAGRPRPPFPYPPLGFIGFLEILDNPLRYVHSKSMDFIDFHEIEGGAWDLAAGRPAGRPAGPAGRPPKGGN